MISQHLDLTLLYADWTCTVKKVHKFPVSSRDVTNQTPPGQEQFSYDAIFPAQGEFGSDIPAGDGKLAILFFTVCREINSLTHSHLVVLILFL